MKMPSLRLFLLSLACPALLISLSGCIFNAQARTANTNGKITPKLVIPLYQSTRTELERRNKKSITDDLGSLVYPFQISNDQGKGIGTLSVVLGESASPQDKPLCVEVEFDKPAADANKALQAIGVPSSKGRWKQDLRQPSAYYVFEYRKRPKAEILPISVRGDLKWITIGTGR